MLKRAIAHSAAPKGLEQAFAARLQISPSMWSQIKSSRPIGDKLARQIEQHSESPQAGSMKSVSHRGRAKPSSNFSPWRGKPGAPPTTSGARRCEPI